MNLEMLFSNSLVELQDGLNIYDSELKPREGTAQYICRSFQRLAMSHILISKDGGEYTSLLSHSAHCWINYLEKGKAKKRAVTHSTPFFDAVACGDWESAQKIAKLSPQKVNTTFEYEEDFYYMRGLMALACGDEAEALRYLSEYETLMDGSTEAGLEILKVLCVTKENKSFTKALKLLTDQLLSIYKEKEEEERVNFASRMLDTKIDLQAIALVKIARFCGIDINKQYQLVPSSTLIDYPDCISEKDAWRKIDFNS